MREIPDIDDGSAPHFAPAKDLPKLLGSVNWNKHSKFRMDRKKAEPSLCSMYCI